MNTWVVIRKFSAYETETDYFQSFEEAKAFYDRWNEPAYAHDKMCLAEIKEQTE